MTNGIVLLFLRTMVLYPLAGVLAARFAFVTFDPNTNVACVDIDGMSILLAAALTTLFAAPVFAWSRWLKQRGLAT